MAMKYPDFVDTNNIVEIGNSTYRYLCQFLFLNLKAKRETFLLY